MVNTLNIIGLHAEVDGQKIIDGLNLKIESGEIHVIMGPNGSGKSTLLKAIMGHPKYTITKGKVELNGKNILGLETYKRAQLGIFLGFQHPLEVPGVKFSNFLRQARNANIKAHDKNAKLSSPMGFALEMHEKADDLKLDKKFVSRSVNEGFSGGEKKRAEIIQMAMLKPKFALLDEIDSGLDIDALKVTSEAINKAHKENNLGLLLITHYQRILNYINPMRVHIMSKGKIIKSGDHKLAKDLEKNGYEKYAK